MLEKEARQKMRLSRSQFSQLLATMKDFVESKPSNLDKRQKILVLKYGIENYSLQRNILNSNGLILKYVRPIQWQSYAFAGTIFQASLETKLASYKIGEDLEYADLVKYIYVDNATGQSFFGNRRYPKLLYDLQNQHHHGIWAEGDVRR